MDRDCCGSWQSKFIDFVLALMFVDLSRMSNDNVYVNNMIIYEMSEQNCVVYSIKTRSDGFLKYL